MNKLNLAIIPFFLGIAMKDGEPSRKEQFLNRLGLSDDVLKMLEGEDDIEETVKRFKSDFESLTKKNYLENWDEETKNKIISETQLGTYNRVEKLAAKTLGLSLEEFKDVEKGRLEHMLNAAKKNYELSIEDWKGKASKAKDLPALQQMEDQLATANAELEELRKLKEDVPNLVESARKEVLNNMFRKDQTRNILAQLRKDNKIIDHIDDDTIMMHLNNVAKLDVVEKDGKSVISILDKNTGKPIMRSATDNYKDLGLLVVDKILAPKNWIKKSNGKPNDNPIVEDGNGGNNGGKKKYTINQKALDAAKRR